MKNKQLEEMTKRIEELIKAANTNKPNALAAFLVEHGVCDAQEIEEREEEAFTTGYAAGEN